MGVEHVDAVVIGAGVVGLAAARALAKQGREVLILESAEAFGTGTSARNSEVLHAGLYYPSHWLKTQLCIQGRPRLERFCDAFAVPWQKIGKLVVAAHQDELPALSALEAQARANGVGRLDRIAAAEALAMEPALTPNVAGALWSPNTGIIDSGALMQALLGDAQAHGAMLALLSPVVALQSGALLGEAGVVVTVHSDPPMRLVARTVVNAAGHQAPALARTMVGAEAHGIPKTWHCKGNYFALTSKPPFSHLVYPMANKDTLGTHLTLDLGGQARFGPDLQWYPEGADMPGYEVDASRQAAFEAAVRRFWPGLPAHALQPAFCGLRPKIHGPHEPLVDFVIQGPSTHGVPGLVNLFGIESPGLTACLAVADAALQTLG